LTVALFIDSIRTDSQQMNQSPTQTAVTGQALAHMWTIAALEAAQFDGPFAALPNSTLDIQ
jgi:hypothetical protein